MLCPLRGQQLSSLAPSWMLPAKLAVCYWQKAASEKDCCQIRWPEPARGEHQLRWFEPATRVAPHFMGNCIETCVQQESNPHLRTYEVPALTIMLCTQKVKKSAQKPKVLWAEEDSFQDSTPTSLAFERCVPLVGLEPARAFAHGILSAECLPFHHSGFNTCSTP